MLPIKFPFICPSGFRGEDFFNSNLKMTPLSAVALYNYIHYSLNDENETALYRK
jgi:hypothetical protein